MGALSTFHLLKDQTTAATASLRKTRGLTARSQQGESRVHVSYRHPDNNLDDSLGFSMTHKTISHPKCLLQLRGKNADLNAFLLEHDRNNYSFRLL